MVVWNRRADSQVSEAAFWQQILMASKFSFADARKRPARVESIFLCKERFIAIANSANRNYAVLLIDEAQDMTLREWKWLVGLQNDLDYEGYLLSVFSIGSHQLSYRHEYMASTGNAHIAARFMAAHAKFRGLQSPLELEYVLNAYDVDSEWPAGSNISFLEYFAPGAYLSGRRLTEAVQQFWMALVELSPNEARRHREFPMQHIARTVEALLLQLATETPWDDVMSYENLLRELSRTNFSDHMRIISTGA
ncbi:ATP-binding protein [Pandoraea commovens]|uniref:ATP-binding protein n=2 Tax=Pandoraea commovens TaxID=2508289 RepID=A0A5E4RLP8_9BURK|nr:ATP-binding protein [Pandoraea commovens]